MNLTPYLGKRLQQGTNKACRGGNGRLFGGDMVPRQGGAACYQKVTVTSYCCPSLCIISIAVSPTSYAAIAS